MTGRNFKLEKGSSWLARSRPQTSTMRSDNRLTDCQPHTDTACLCRVEWVKKTGKILWAQPRTCILNANADTFILHVLGADQQLAWSIIRSTHCLHGIDGQVQHHLLKLQTVPLDMRQLRCQLYTKGHSVFRRLAAGQYGYLLDGLIDIHRLLLHRPFLCKVHQAGDDIAASARTLNGPLETKLRLSEIGRLRCKPPQTGVSVDLNGTERLSEFVGNRGGELPGNEFTSADHRTCSAEAAA